jgi:hypothetical protein
VGFTVGSRVILTGQDGVERGDLIAAYERDVESFGDGFAAVGSYFESKKSQAERLVARP